HWPSHNDSLKKTKWQQPNSANMLKPIWKPPMNFGLYFPWVTSAAAAPHDAASIPPHSSRYNEWPGRGRLRTDANGSSVIPHTPCTAPVDEKKIRSQTQKDSVL